MLGFCQQVFDELDRNQLPRNVVLLNGIMQRATELC